MRILITNDDGIHAEGLKVLEEIASELSDDVTVVAPETDQSGVAHSLSLSDPLRLREVSPRHYAVRGTPTDCVIMGVRKILADRKPDLVLSGVNRGQNVAEDVTYSGTIAGAMEGAMLGVPAIALSQAYCTGETGRPHDRLECLAHLCAAVDPQDRRRRHSRRRARQCQFSRLRIRRSRRRRVRAAGTAQRGTHAHRRATRRARLSLLLADVPARRDPFRPGDGPRRHGVATRSR